MRVSETSIPGVFLRHYPSGRDRYWWTIRVGRRRYRRAARRNTLKGAVAERDQALLRLAAGLAVDDVEGDPYTVSQACKDYLAACEALRSYPTCRLHADRLTEYFGDLPVDDLSQVTIAAFRKKRLEDEVSQATVNRALSFLRAALNHAKGESRITGENYFARLSKADRRKVFVEEARTAGLRRVSDDQIESVIRRLPEPFQAPARLLLATAMRKGEVLGLRWAEIRENALYVTRTKSGKPRWVPLTAQALSLLPARPEGAPDDDLVFLGRDGGSIRNNFDRAWRQAREDAELPWLRVHDLRHEAASRYLEAGGTLRELQELGGWSDLKMVERYSKVTRERILATLEKVPQPSAESTLSPHAKRAKLRAIRK